VTSIDDRKDFATVQKALSIMGFSEDEVKVGRHPGYNWATGTFVSPLPAADPVECFGGNPAPGMRGLYG